MISIFLTSDQAKLVIDSLAASARECRTTAESYPDDTKARILGDAAVYHDLCETISTRLEQEGKRKPSNQQKVDPFDNSWPLNDPRGW
jgi:hypothetical protein